MAKQRTQTLGMIVHDIANPFFPQVIRGVESVVNKSGFSLITINTDDQLQLEREALRVLRSRRVDGILLVIAPGRRDNNHISRVIEANIPVVCLDRLPSGRLHVDCVAADNFKGSREAVRHLIAMRHRHIAIVTGPPTLKNALDRLKGYSAALVEAGLPVDDNLILEGDFRQDTGRRICQELASSGKQFPTAFFISNNLMAIGALEGLTLQSLLARNAEFSYDLANRFAGTHPLRVNVVRNRLGNAARRPSVVGAGLWRR